MGMVTHYLSLFNSTEIRYPFQVLQDLKPALAIRIIILHTGLSLLISGFQVIPWSSLKIDLSPDALNLFFIGQT